MAVRAGQGDHTWLGVRQEATTGPWRGLVCEHTRPKATRAVATDRTLRESLPPTGLWRENVSLLKAQTLRHCMSLPQHLLLPEVPLGHSESSVMGRALLSPAGHKDGVATLKYDPILPPFLILFT